MPGSPASASESGPVSESSRRLRIVLLIANGRLMISLGDDLGEMQCELSLSMPAL